MRISDWSSDVCSSDLVDLCPLPRASQDGPDCSNANYVRFGVARGAQIATWLPSSTTRLVGRRKYSIALSELRSIHANNFSRQIGIPGDLAAIKVWRDRKKLVSSILNSPPHPPTRFSAAGTSTGCLKP